MIRDDDAASIQMYRIHSVILEHGRGDDARNPFAVGRDRARPNKCVQSVR